MNYKLTKKLKNAGFPNSKDWWDLGGYFVETPDHEEKPTLSELIEALGTGEGNSFFNLEGHFSHDFGWQATWRIMVDMELDKVEEIKEWANTPEESVAKLWLKLNEKNAK